MSVIEVVVVEPATACQSVGEATLTELLKSVEPRTGHESVSWLPES